MRPRSIISLIIAAVFVLGGIITCAVASAMAESAGVMLFPEGDADGNLVYRMELDDITKLTVNTADADITVVGGAETSYIEVINFNANFYKLTSTGGSLNFNQLDDLMSMFKFWDNGFSFKGMRYLLRFGDDTAGDRRVVINLSDDSEITLMNLSSASGTVSVKDCSQSASYTLSSGTGKTEIENIKGASSVSVNGTAVLSASDVSAERFIVSSEKMRASMSRVKVSSATVTVSDGSFDAKNSDFGSTIRVTSDSASVSLSDCMFAEGDINTKSGPVDLKLLDISIVSANVSTKSGRISDRGTYVESFSKNTANPIIRINVSTDAGDVSLKY